MRSKLEKEHRVRGKRGRPQHGEEYRGRKRGRPQLEEVLRVSGKRGRSQHRGGGCSQRKERQATPGEGVQSQMEERQATPGGKTDRKIGRPQLQKEYRVGRKRGRPHLEKEHGIGWKRGHTLRKEKQKDRQATTGGRVQRKKIGRPQRD